MSPDSQATKGYPHAACRARTGTNRCGVLRSLADLVNDRTGRAMRYAAGSPLEHRCTRPRPPPGATPHAPAPSRRRWRSTYLRSAGPKPIAAASASPKPGAPGPSRPRADRRQHVETWRLVSLAQEGDGEAFGQLYDRYVDTVFRFIYFRVNDRGLAEDFTSETFLRALRRIGTISYQGRDIGAWFITIARNIVLDHLKSARHRLEITTADTIEGKEYAPEHRGRRPRRPDSPSG